MIDDSWFFTELLRFGCCEKRLVVALSALVQLYTRRLRSTQDVPGGALRECSRLIDVLQRSGVPFDATCAVTMR